MVKADLKRREVEGWKHKYTEILDCGNVNFLGARLIDKGTPVFSFTLAIQEVDCTVEIKDPSKVKEGNDGKLVQTTYSIVLSRHSDPDIAITGHYWDIVEFNKVG